MMKKPWTPLLCLLLCASLLASCAPKAVPAAPAAPDAIPDAAEALPEETPAMAGMPNPLIDCESYEALLAAVPGTMLADAPEGAENVAYTYISGMEPVIAEVRFDYAGCDYTYRAAACASPEAMADISGVYDSFAHKEENVTYGGSYTLQHNDGKPEGLATWYYAPTLCQYSLFTTTGADELHAMEEVVDMLLPLTTAADGSAIEVPADTVDAADKPAQDGEVTGTVLSVADNSIVVRLDNGSSIVFLMTYMENTFAKAGDSVTVSYAGSITETPEALAIKVTGEAKADPVLSGVVSGIEGNTLHIATATGNVFGFDIQKAKFTGAATEAVLGASVNVTYTGDITNLPQATLVETVELPAPAPTPAALPADVDPALVNKTLKGVVTKLSTKNFTLLASSGHSYTFKKSSASAVTGKYALAQGTTVQVTYDGYASKSPLAKRIEVIAPPDPTPPKPTPTTQPTQLHTVNGMVTMHAGNALSVQANNGQVYSFLLGAPTISGDTWGYPGDYATVSYYTSGGGNVVVSVYFQSAYNPPVPTAHPVPVPTLPPEPCTTRTISGIIVVMAGNALSVQCGGQLYDFLLGAPEISGDPDAGPGDKASVTFTQCGDNITVKRVHYTCDLPLLLGPDPVIVEPEDYGEQPTYDFYGARY